MEPVANPASRNLQEAKVENLKLKAVGTLRLLVQTRAALNLLLIMR